ncbi:MAG: hypothetical protein K2I96_00020 [Lachnospiraceae bacterium]|nr:hypothetical protein [Lachnospiraceae bacterium]
MLKRMVNTDRDFYKYMGQIFGSRVVQRVTSDRFYDDSGKEWIMEIDKNIVVAVISVKDSIIKNVYAEDTLCLIKILKEIFPEISAGVVPNVYKEMYVTAGFEIIEEKKNFLKIKGGKDIEQN